MKLYFQNSKCQERLIGEPKNEKELFSIINKFLDEHNYKSYYTRMWKEGNRTYYDVGSWSEFFFIEE